MNARRLAAVVAASAALAVTGAPRAGAQPVVGPPAFKHVIVIVQENRTPDSLFHALCFAPPVPPVPRCSTSPNSGQYEIQTEGWLDKSAPGRRTNPVPIPLQNWYDLGHSHASFILACDPVQTGAHECRMDGSASVSCRPPEKGPPCPPRPQFRYVSNARGIISPYIQIAMEYGWANRMFQANQGPSYPAHQFLFGATSAPTKADDARGVFASENIVGTGATGGFNKPAGCTSPKKTRTIVLHPDGTTTQIYPCYEHRTMGDLLGAISWRYYVPSPTSIWTAPNSIRHICQPNGHYKKAQCLGPMYTQHVVMPPPQVRTDIANCKLQSMSWVIPSGRYSDHAGPKSGHRGPSWVAAIVNDIGASRCGYWNDTAIIVTWDDWGGWYDHVPPPFYHGVQGDYQYGFRVPLLVVSKYTPRGYVDNGTHDFGSILRFVEGNFRLGKGALGFDDSRATTDLSTFFTSAARPFVHINAPPFSQADAADRSEPDDG